MNNRRKLVIALGAGTLVGQAPSFAQQLAGKMHRIGFLSAGSAAGSPNSLEAMRVGLRELGYAEGKSHSIEFRWAEGKYESLPSFAAELVNLKVDIIVAISTTAALAAQKATSTIPIVMAGVADPVGIGLIKNLARPGGNVTGFSSLSLTVGLKRLEMLFSMVPKGARVAALLNPTSAQNVASWEQILAMGKQRGISMLRVDARTPQEIENAFATMVQEKVRAVFILADSFLTPHGPQIAALAAKHRLLSSGGYREYAEAGGLMSYGINGAASFGQVAIYVDKILKGAKPGDLPVQEPMKFELIINMKTAKALGVKIPQSILVLADKVIE